MTFRDYLSTQGLTVASLADMADVRRSSLERFASGQSKWSTASLWFAQAVAEVLGLEAGELMQFDRE